MFQDSFSLKKARKIAEQLRAQNTNHPPDPPEGYPLWPPVPLHPTIISGCPTFASQCMEDPDPQTLEVIQEIDHLQPSQIVLRQLSPSKMGVLLSGFGHAIVDEEAFGDH